MDVIRAAAEDKESLWLCPGSLNASSCARWATKDKMLIEEICLSHQVFALVKSA